VFKAGFRFLDTFRDKTGTRMKVYNPATLYKGDTKWYVLFYYRNPDTDKFQRFRVYEDINRVKGDEQDKN